MSTTQDCSNHEGQAGFVGLSNFTFEVVLSVLDYEKRSFDGNENSDT